MTSAASDRPARLRIGTAGWSISSPYGDAFPSSGSGLARYSARFDCVEINSTFYRRHRPATFARWMETVPEAFRFSVKLPRTITHERRLVDAPALLDAFFEDVKGLGAKLGPVLVQLPPSLPFDPPDAARFFEQMRARFEGAIVCEPRHATWFRSEALDLLSAFRVGRVAADPEPVRGAGAAEPAGEMAVAYIRLHGSPTMYRSPYGVERVTTIAKRLVATSASETWCIFDNTAGGAALGDALTLLAMIRAGTKPLLPKAFPRRS